jgi:hypothetical protein
MYCPGFVSIYLLLRYWLKKTVFRVGCLADEIINRPPGGEAAYCLVLHLLIFP